MSAADCDGSMARHLKSAMSVVRRNHSPAVMRPFVATPRSFPAEHARCSIICSIRATGQRMQGVWWWTTTRHDISNPRGRAMVDTRGSEVELMESPRYSPTIPGFAPARSPVG